MIKLFKTLSTGILLLMLCMSTQAALLTGKVINQENEPLPGVSVASDISGIGTLSDLDGNFKLDTEQPITRLTFSSVGYISRQFAAEQLPETIVLTRLYYRGSDIAVHSTRAERGVTPVSFDNISADDIERDYTVQEFPLLLESTPNAYVYSDGGASLGYTYVRIRGFDDRRIVTYVNGVPLNDPEDQVTYFIDLPDFAANVSDIQVQRGVGNSLYGDASFGGSINVVTNSLAQQRQAVFTSGFGSYQSDGESVGKTYKQSLQFSSGLIDGRWAFGGRFSKQRSDGYREKSWYDGWSYYFSAARLDHNMTTELYVFGGPMKVHAAWYGATREDIAMNRRVNVGIPGYEELSYDNAIDNFNQPQYQLHNRYRLNDHTTLSNTLYYIRGKGYYEQYKPDQLLIYYGITPLYTDGSANADLVRQKWVEKKQIGWNPRLDFDHDKGRHSIGGSLYYFRSDHFGRVVWAQHLTGPLDPQHKYYNHFGRKYLGSFFAQELYRFNDKLTAQFTGQLRWQNYDFFQVAMGPYPGYSFDLSWLFFSPRIGFTYQIDKTTSLYSNFSISQRTPSDAAIYDADDPQPGTLPFLEIVDSSMTESGSYLYGFGDPTIKSEKLFDFELGGEYKKKSFALGANLYWMYFKDMIVGEGGVTDGIENTLNVDAVLHSGVELTAAAQATEQIKLSGNFAYNYNRILDFVYEFTYDFDTTIGGNPTQVEETVSIDLDGNKTPRFPVYLANIVADFEQSDYRITWRGRFIGHQYAELRNIETYSIDPLFVSSLSASYTFDKFIDLGQLTLSGRIDNLFDKKYEAAVAYAENYAYRVPNEAATIDAFATYFVAPERSYYVQLQLSLF